LNASGRLLNIHDGDCETGEKVQDAGRAGRMERQPTDAGNVM